MRTLAEPVTLDVDTLPRLRLVELLGQALIQLNESATTLLNDAIFDRPSPESVTVVERSVSDLGLPSGAVLQQIFEAAQEHGLTLCPPTTGPFLRLVLRSQASASDAVMSNGKAPSGSLTVASPALRVTRTIQRASTCESSAADLGSAAITATALSTCGVQTTGSYSGHPVAEGPAFQSLTIRP